MYTTIRGSSGHKSHTRSVIIFFKVFQNSGFTRSLCGGQWEALSSNSFLPTTGRLGCCSPGTFMAKPNSNPFNQTTSCETCPAGYYGSNDDTRCFDCPSGTLSIIGSPSCLYNTTTCPMVDCDIRISQIL